MIAFLAALPLLTAAWSFTGVSRLGLPTAFFRGQGQTTIRIRRFVADVPLPRAGRPVTLRANVENTGKAAIRIAVRLSVPRGVRVTEQPAEKAGVWTAAGDEVEM